MQVEECAAIRVGVGGMLEVSGCQPLIRRSKRAAGIEISEDRILWQPVAEASIPTPWGAIRRLLCCPHCRRRVRALHRPPAHWQWACRTCWGLSYASRQAWDKRVEGMLRGTDLDALLLLPMSAYPSEHVAFRVMFRLADMQ